MRSSTRTPSPPTPFIMPPPPYSSECSQPPPVPRSDSSSGRSFYAHIFPTMIKLLIGVGLVFTLTYLSSFTMNASHKMKLREIMSDRAAAECLDKISANNSLLFTEIRRNSLNCSGLLQYLTDRAICKLEYDRLKIIGKRAGRGLYVEVQKMDEAEEEIANGTLADYVDEGVSVSAELIATDMETDNAGEEEEEEEEEEEKEG